ncbi:MAG: TRAP transporter substrate-binding protein DctP [Candidatus Neomarinimicrobiota bacterium]
MRSAAQWLLGWLALCLVALAAVNPLQAKAWQLQIKMATLAPEGSPWHMVLEDISADWRELSAGRVLLQIYAGGVVGDESDMVRKMRIGQVHAAALTAEGLSYIDNGIYALSLPLLVKDYRELDWIRARVEPELRRRYEAKGFVVLAWADVGWVYWFSRQPVHTPADLRRLRIFTWAGDAHTPRLWKAAGFEAVSLSAVDVLPGLQTGLIDAVQTSPLTMASFQWFGAARHMTNLPWAALTGGLIVTDKAWEQVPSELRPQLLAAVQKRALRIKNEIRHSDAEAVRVMREHGLAVVDITPEEEAQWEHLVREHGRSLRGTLVDTAMFDWVQTLKGELRRPEAVLP